MATKVILNYPLPENMDEYERRAARAAARLLIDILPPKTIDQLIEKLKDMKE